ncbi:uncharacterized protein O3C94_003114 [Discoglossus pictus]
MTLGAYTIRILKDAGCIQEELLDEMNVDDEQKDLIRKGSKTGDWTGLTTKYGHHIQPIVSWLVKAVLIRVDSFIADLEGGVKKDLVKLGLTLDGPQPTHQKNN